MKLTPGQMVAYTDPETQKPMTAWYIGPAGKGKAIIEVQLKGGKKKRTVSRREIRQLITQD